MKKFRTVTPIALAVLLSGAAAAPAHAGLPQRVEVRLAASGMELSTETVHAGIVVIRVSAVAADHVLQIFRPHRGVTVQEVLAAAGGLFGNDPAAAVRALRRDATFYGGAEGPAGFDMTLTQRLRAGTYSLLDLADIGRGSAAVKELHVVGRAGRRRLHRGVATVRMVDSGGAHHFTIKGRLTAGADFSVVNSSDELHEASFAQLRPGATDAQIQASLDAEAAGTTPPPNPIVGDAGAVKLLSPGRRILVHIERFAVARYALLCFIPDADSGRPHAYDGMHLIVAVRS